MQDPTRDEMLTLFKNEEDSFNVEAAIYWFASDYHGGQATNLYEALCQSPYNPGPLERCVPDSALMYFETLEEGYHNEG